MTELSVGVFYIVAKDFFLNKLEQNTVYNITISSKDKLQANFTGNASGH